MIHRLKGKPKFHEVLEAIEQADGEEIDEILQAVIRRYGRVFPDWEVFFVSVPKNNTEERKHTVEALIDFLKKHG